MNLGPVGLAAAALAATLAPSGAAAQEQTAPAQTVGEVIVTAQKREERLQDVPVAVSVVAGEALDAQGGINIENAQYLVPALNFRKSGASINQSLFLRGVGTINFSIAAEPSVSTVLDGVVLSRSGEAFADLVDLERIEVLRGPQGTLFGKNASAGVVNLVSRRPGETFGGYLDAAWFEGDERRVRAALDVPLSDSVRTRLSAFAAGYDGNVENRTLARTVNGYERWGVRGILEADVSPELRLTVIGDWREADDDCCAEIIGTPPTGLAAQAYPAGSFRAEESRELFQNLLTRSVERSGGLSVQADWQLGGAGTLTSITAYRLFDDREVRDGDFLDRAYVGFPQAHDDGPQEGDTLSQELRLASPSGGRLEYVAGLYASRAESDRVFARDVITCAAAPGVTLTALTPCGAAGTTAPVANRGVGTFGSTFDNLAAFGQGTYALTGRLRLLAGLRYTLDRVEVYHSRRSTSPTAIPGVQPSFPTPVSGIEPAGVFTAEVDETNLSGRLGARYDLSDAVMGYASYTRGYKGPAFNTFFNLTAVGTNAIAAETVDSYEAGLKGTAWNGRLAANLAAFYARYENYQANNPELVAGFLTTRLTNAGEVSTRGFELDLTAEPLPRLVLTGGVAYAEAKVDQFNLPPGALPSQVIPAGTELAIAPKWKAALAADYRLVTGGPFDLGLRGALAHQSSQLSQFDASAAIRAATRIESYTLVDAQMSVIEASDRYRVTLIGRNLFDEAFAASIASGGPGGGYRYIIPREADRYWGVSLRAEF